MDSRAFSEAERMIEPKGVDFCLLVGDPMAQMEERQRILEAERFA
jgi:hypothetical protein